MRKCCAMILVLYISLVCTSCIEHKNLKFNEVAIINDHTITKQDIKNKLNEFKLEKLVFEYDYFKNNIYSNLELLHVREDDRKNIISLLLSKELEKAQEQIENFYGYEDGEVLKYFLIKQIKEYEQILNKQDNVILAFEELLKETIILKKCQEKSLIPSDKEIHHALELQQNSLNDKIETNPFYACFYDFYTKTTKELFHLDQKEYTNLEFEKVKKNLLKENLTKEISPYPLNRYIQDELKSSNIIINRKYQDYEKNLSN